MGVEGKPGDLLAGRYRLLEQLGEGGMGSVWKAEHISQHTRVAIKIIDPEIADVEFNLARFLREAKTLASLHSPHVVRVLDYGADTDTAYLVMDLLEGETLGQRLTLLGRLSLEEVTLVLRDVCAAMTLVHGRGVIHRDLKPDNIFLCSVDGRLVAKVVDFGIAKPFRGPAPSFSTRTGHVLGTPAYMSPEHCRGLKDVDQRTDVWSLGVIAYQCLVGRPPFDGDALVEMLLRICMDPPPVPSRESASPLPLAFDAWFGKAVARDPSDRFQSTEELFAAFARLSTSRGSSAAAAPSPPNRTPDEAPTQPVSGAKPGTAAPDRHASSVGLAVVVRQAFESRARWGAGAVLLALVVAIELWRLGASTVDERHLTVGSKTLNGAISPAADAPAPERRPLLPTRRRPEPSHPAARDAPSDAGAAPGLPKAAVPAQTPDVAREAVQTTTGSAPLEAPAPPLPPRAPHRTPPWNDIRRSR